MAVSRLTAVWALSESGLGGVMHALKLPFTGFFVGGFAVIIISLIAWHGHSSKSILRATLSVILVKAAASPQSPFMAYVAVGFQGCIAALLFGIISNFKVAAIIFGIIAMLESALQILLMAALIFGASLWTAVNDFFKDIAKDLHLPATVSFSFIIIGIYAVIYALWGALLGKWAGSMPGQFALRSGQVNAQVKALSAGKETGITLQKNKWYKRLVAPFFTLAFIVIVFLTGGAQHGAGKAVYAVLRTMGALLLLNFLVAPLLKWLLNKLLQKNVAGNKSEIQDLLQQLPALRTNIGPAYRLACNNTKGLARFRELVFILIVISLNNDSNEH